MITVSLDGLFQIGLIVSRASGIMYDKQTDRESGTRDTEEGILIPLPSIPKGIISDLLTAAGANSPHVSEHEANQIDEVFDTYGYGVRVDRDRMHDLRPTWIPVVVVEPRYFREYVDIPFTNGVLTFDYYSPQFAPEDSTPR